MRTEEVNFAYYDAHYDAAHPLLFWLRGKLSFDQQSKTRPNLSLLRPALLDLQRRLAPRPLRVLDYGSGFGTLLLGLPRDGLQLFAYDISPRAMSQLQAVAAWLGRRVEPFAGFSDGEPGYAGLDVIVCSHVLEHVESDAELVKCFARALRPGGLLLVNVPIHELWDDPKHVRRYCGDELFALLASHGFEVVSTRRSDRWTAWLSRREQAPNRSHWTRHALRGVRALLSVLPATLIEWAEQRGLAELPPQQLLILAVKR